MPALETVTFERDGHVLLIGLNRPDKRNAFTQAMLADLARAYGLLESDPSVRVGCCSHTVTTSPAVWTWSTSAPTSRPAISRCRPTDETLALDGRGPRRWRGRARWCMTLGIELLLAADIRVAATGTRFAQLEVQRGIYPFGGATLRLPREGGWGNAMRWLLTGDEFDAAEAPASAWCRKSPTTGSAAFARAREIAQTIAGRAAPLAVQVTLTSAHLAREQGDAAAIERLRPDVAALFATADAAEGVQSFIERRQAQFQGR